MNLRKNIFWAIPFIVVGIVWLLKNMGMIATDIFDIIVSWQMLVMYVGVSPFFSRQYVGGLITFLFGLYFLMPELDWMGGCEDKRFNASVNMDNEHVLVVRGNATFGGIEFKS